MPGPRYFISVLLWKNGIIHGLLEMRTSETVELGFEFIAFVMPVEFQAGNKKEADKMRRDVWIYQKVILVQKRCIALGACEWVHCTKSVNKFTDEIETKF